MTLGVEARPGALFERQPALAEVERAVKAAAGGQGSAVVVRGPAGIGKTTLLEEAARRVRRQGMRVLVARGTRLEREFAFGVVRQLFDPLLMRAGRQRRERMFGGAARLADPLFGMDGPSELRVDFGVDASGFAILHGLWWLLGNVAAEQPVGLVVDDMHWCDGASSRWLAFLAPRIRDVPVVLLASGRSDEPQAPAEWAALRETASAVVELDPLSLAASTELLGRELVDVPTGRFAEACHRATGGNPFFLTELARDLRARGIHASDENVTAVSSLAPDTVARSVVGRLAARSPDVGRLARAVAVLGEEVSVLDAAELAEMDEATARYAAAMLVELAILRSAQELKFEHPIVRDAIYESIPPVIRAGMHRQAVGILERRGRPLEMQAAHLLRTEPGSDPSVVSTLRRAAAEAAARGATDTAADYLARAAVEPPPIEDRAEVLADLGYVELRTGRPAAAEHLRAAAAEAEDPAVRAQAVSDLTGVLVLQGDVDAAVAVADEARAKLGGGAPALAIDTQLLMVGLIGRGSVWARLAGRLHALADQARAAGEEGRPLLAMLAADQIRRGGSQAVTGELAVAALAEDTLLSRGPDYPPFLFAVYAAIRGDEIEFAVGVLERALQVARERGSLPGYAFASCYLGMAQILCNELDASEANLRGALDAARENAWPLLEWQVLNPLLILLAKRGYVDDAQAELERGGFEDELPNNVIGTALLAGRAVVRYGQGRWQEAYEDFVECGRRNAEYSDRSRNYWWRADASMALAHLGRHAQALELAEAELAIAREWGDPVEVARALHARGVAGGEAGLNDLQAAAELLDGLNGLGHVACLVDLGATLRRANRRRDAREYLYRALELAERLGTPRYAARARTELAAAGARPRRVLRTGLDSLTPSELRIAKLASAGLSNPAVAQELFVTRKTVEKHLGNVYLKLDISSRERLPALLAAGGHDSVG